MSVTIPFWFIASNLFLHIRSVKIKRWYLILSFIISLLSAYNLITHKNTSKRSYNLPVGQLSSLLKKNHNNNKLIFTHEPALKYNLTNQNIKVHDLYDKFLPSEIIIEKGTSVYTVNTYQGSFTDQKYEKVLLLYRKLESCMEEVQRENIGIDKYYTIKNKIGGSRPKMEDQFQMHISSGKIKDTCVLSASAFPFF